MVVAWIVIKISRSFIFFFHFYLYQFICRSNKNVQYVCLVCLYGRTLYNPLLRIKLHTHTSSTVGYLECVGRVIVENKLFSRCVHGMRIQHFVGSWQQCVSILKDMTFFEPICWHMSIAMHRLL